MPKYRCFNERKTDADLVAFFKDTNGCERKQVKKVVNFKDRMHGCQQGNDQT